MVKLRKLGVGQGGFTLIELMVVALIITVLATIGVPYYNKYILRTNLYTAVPYMEKIVTQAALHYQKYGTYDSYNEDDLRSKLGIDVSTVGDFCFDVFCRDDPGGGKACENFWGQDYNTGVNTSMIYVRAILRGPAKGNPLSGSYRCNSATFSPKADPTGWVLSAAVGGPGSETRAIILAYPRPPDGTGPATDMGHGSIPLQWENGLSITDAISP